jgi:peptidoglycan/LPS O-acetylase OafA/YrhL
MGMTLFFVLSGFVIWVNYAESFRERFLPSLWRFGVARFARLYPLYFAVGLIVLFGTHWTKLPNALPDGLLFIPQLQAWVRDQTWRQPRSQFPISRTRGRSALRCSFTCVPVIALLMMAVRSRRVLLALALANVAICVAEIWFYADHIPEMAAHLAPGMPIEAANMWNGYYSPLTRVGEFVAGCIVGAIITRSEPAVKPGWHGLGLVACVAALIIVVALYSTSIGLSHGARTAAQRAGPLACFAYLVWFLARFDSGAAQAL